MVRLGSLLSTLVCAILNTTGYMHNRLRMITAHFLAKNLLIDWRMGERYFISKLGDGDFPNKNGG